MGRGLETSKEKCARPHRTRNGAARARPLAGWLAPVRFERQARRNSVPPERPRSDEGTPRPSLLKEVPPLPTKENARSPTDSKAEPHVRGYS